MSNHDASIQDSRKDSSTLQPIELALNLADFGHERTLCSGNPDIFKARVDTICAEAANHYPDQPFTRIYVGSYFCDQFFLSLDDSFFQTVSLYAREKNMALTLVVPIFGQQTLSRARSRIQSLVDSCDNRGFCFDEVVVNDPAMALFAGEIAAERLKKAQLRPSGNAEDPELRIVYGRMMAKSPRDPRHAVMAESAQPYALDKERAQAAKNTFGYSLLEMDPTAPIVDATALEDALPYALHAPHCFMTTGHICQAASIGRPTHKKFRADSPCAQQCLGHVQVYEHRCYDDDSPAFFTRHGRTVYFENPGCVTKGTTPTRIIWTPADFLCASPELAVPAAENPIPEQVWGPYWDAGWIQPQEGGVSWE